MPDVDQLAAILAGIRDDQHPGQRSYQGPCAEADQCLTHRDCPLFGSCAKARALADDRAYEDYITATYL